MEQPRLSDLSATEPQPISPEADVNAIVSGALRDLANVQASVHSRWGYKRAAAAIAQLDDQLPALIERHGSLPKIAHVGPRSTQVIREVLETGRSETVDRAVAASGRIADIRRRRSLRTNFLSRAEVRRILGSPHNAVSAHDYRGDLQMHSTWSDGSAPIAALASAAIARGYDYIAVTDHSKGLPIAGGLSPASVAAQRIEIDDINRSFDSKFRVLKGLETNILADGTLDVDADERRALEVVLAAPHSKLRSTDDQTRRLIRTIETAGVHILAHPRGRMSDSREGLRAEWSEVFAAAAQARVAIEIDGDPARQDLDWSLAEAALAPGCLFALDSDAHNGDQLVYADTALAHARRAGIPSSRIVNCWPLPKLLDWLQSRSRP